MVTTYTLKYSKKAINPLVSLTFWQKMDMSEGLFTPSDSIVKMIVQPILPVSVVAMMTRVF